MPGPVEQFLAPPHLRRSTVCGGQKIVQDSQDSQQKAELAVDILHPNIGNNDSLMIMKAFVRKDPASLRDALAHGCARAYSISSLTSLLAEHVLRELQAIEMRPQLRSQAG